MTGTSFAAANKNFINVREAPYNAIGDGVTDDTAAFNAAITAAAVLGRSVFVPATGAQYLITGQITMHSGTRIIGENAVDYSASIGSILLLSGATAGIRFNGVFQSGLEYLQLFSNSSAGSVIQMNNGDAACKQLYFRHLTINHGNKNTIPIRFGNTGGAHSGVQVNRMRFDHVDINAAPQQSVPLYGLYGDGGGMSNITISSGILTGGGSHASGNHSTAPFIVVENTDTINVLPNIRIEDLELEIPLFGGIWFHGVQESRISNVWFGDNDVPILDHLIKLDPAPHAGTIHSVNNIIDGMFAAGLGQSGQATVKTAGLDQANIVMNSFCPWVDNSGPGFDPIIFIGEAPGGFDGDRPVGLSNSGIVTTAYANAVNSLTTNLTNGANHDVTSFTGTLSGYLRVNQVGAPGAFSIDSIVSQSTDGMMLTLVNPTVQTMTITDNSNATGGTATNRILTGIGTDVTITGPGVASFMYDVTALRWRLVSTQPSSGLFPTAVVSDNLTALPQPAPLFNANVTYVSGIKHALSPTIPIGTFDTAFRIDMANNGGGIWEQSSTITGSNAILVDFAAGNRGTHEILATEMRGLGAGDAIPFSCVTDSWGGATPSEGSASVGIAEAGAIGEFDLAQGGARYSAYNTGAVPTETATTQIFRASVSGSPAPSATTISFSSPTNLDKLGARFILNSNHTTSTGHVTTIAPDAVNQQTVVTFSGVTFTGAAIGRYLKIGASTDLYAVTAMNQLLGDDVFLNGFGVGHWFRIKANPAGNQLTIEGIWDTQAFTNSVAQLPSASYLVMDGAEIQSFTTSSITIPANSYTWSNGDALYSPPNHYQAVLGMNLIMQKLYKTSKFAINASEGIRMVSRGLAPLDYGMRLTGPQDGYGGFNVGIKMENFQPDIAIDLSAINSTTAGIRLSQGESIIMDSSALFPLIRGEGVNGVHIEGQNGQISLFATDNLNSDFFVKHTAVGRVDFLDSVSDTWLTQIQTSSVNIGPGGFGSQAVTITPSKLVSNKGRRINLTHTTISYTILTTDEVIMVEAITTPITVTLPLTPVSGDTYTVKDAQGLAAAHTITVTTADSNTIDGSASVALDRYQSLKLVFNSTSGQWNVI